MNQRPGKTHAATLNDDGVIKLSVLVRYIRSCQQALEAIDDEAAIRFEILGDFLTEDYRPGTPLVFKTKDLGL